MKIYIYIRYVIKKCLNLRYANPINIYDFFDIVWGV